MTEKLLETALGIDAPWYVAGEDFNAQARTLTIRVDFAAGSGFALLLGPMCFFGHWPYLLQLAGH